MCSTLVPSRGLCRIFASRTRHTQCVAHSLVPSRGLCRIVAYRTRHTQCVARLFLRVAYVGSLLIKRGIHNV